MRDPPPILDYRPRPAAQQRRLALPFFVLLLVPVFSSSFSFAFVLCLLLLRAGAAGIRY